MQVQKATIGQPATNQHGALLIKTSITNDGVISLYVTAGAGRIDKLSKAFTNRDEAAAWYRHIAQAAEAGKPVYAIEWEMEALIAAGTAIDVEAIAERINAGGDSYLARETEASDKLAADATEIVGDGRGWTRFRQDATQSMAAATSEPMDQIITAAAHADGRINRGGGLGEADSRQLIALRKRGLVDLVYSRRGNTRVIVGGTLTAKGFKAAGVEMRSAA